jgi:hypothetical protein
MTPRIQCIVTLIVMTLLVVVVLDSLLRWTTAIRGKRPVAKPAQEPVPEPAGL